MLSFQNLPQTQNGLQENRQEQCGLYRGRSKGKHLDSGSHTELTGERCWQKAPSLCRALPASAHTPISHGRENASSWPSLSFHPFFLQEQWGKELVCSFKRLCCPQIHQISLARSIPEAQGKHRQAKSLNPSRLCGDIGSNEQVSAC